MPTVFSTNELFFTVISVPPTITMPLKFPWDVFSGHRFIANRYVPPKIFPENLSHDKKQIGIILIVIFFLAENSYCQEKEYEILLTLRTDKEIYQVGEEILVDFVFICLAAYSSYFFPRQSFCRFNFYFHA